jgi:sortase A
MLRRWLALLSLLVGLASLAQGSWIFGKAALAQVLLRRAWAAARAGDQHARPWPWADTWPVARLLDRARGVDLVVLEGAAGASLAFGPGHIAGSAAPGMPGNIALAGHRDTHFRFLEQLQPGESLWLEPARGAAQRYQVESAAIVDQADTRLLEAQQDGLTLVTCYPFDAPVPGGPLRYVVRARPAAGGALRASPEAHARGELRPPEPASCARRSCSLDRRSAHGSPADQNPRRARDRGSRPAR